MAAIKLKGAVSDKDRHGNVRWYYIKEGAPKVRLNPKGVEIGSPAFFQRYEQARAGILTGKVSPEGTLGALINAYFKSPQFQNMRPTTQASRSGILIKLMKEHGAKSAQMTAAAVRAGRDKRASTPAAANNRVKAISALYSWAVDNGYAEFNPARDIKKFKSGEGYHTWTREQIDQYRAHWPLGTKARLAFELAYGTAQRRGDIAKLGPQHIAGNKIRLVQEKTGKRLTLPITAELASALKQTPPASPLSLLGYKTAGTLGNAFQKWRNEAGLPKICALHGLRKARATHLAEDGKTVKEIAAITGHTTLGEIERYTRDADQAALAERALGEQSIPPFEPTSSSGIVNSRKSKQ